MTHALGESGRISLLVRRAGFAAGQGDAARYEQLGWEATLQELLHPETGDDESKRSAIAHVGLSLPRFRGNDPLASRATTSSPTYRSARTNPT